MKRLRFLPVLFLSLLVVRCAGTAVPPPPPPPPDLGLDEFIIVRFVEDRGVIIDGADSGRTNEIIPVSGGAHRISLAGPLDYQPAWHDVFVSGTSSIQPGKVTFAEKD